MGREGTWILSWEGAHRREGSGYLEKGGRNRAMDGGTLSPQPVCTRQIPMHIPTSALALWGFLLSDQHIPGPWPNSKPQG